MWRSMLSRGFLLVAPVCHCQQGVFSVLTAQSFYPMKHKAQHSEKKMAKRFIDFVRVRVHGGKGGDGLMSFLSLPFNEWAGPDGGDGGNGGHVIFQADENTKSLDKISPQHTADGGVDGSTKNCHGKNANHLYLKVPPGTIFKDTGQTVVADLKKHGDMFVAARGGAGGHGNRFFLSNENRAPTIYEEGGAGEERLLFVELRVMADAGLVGFPNAGKSSLLRAISRARPKVAAYPFTTLNPHVGIVEYDDLQPVAVADVPGLIKGAHQNYGLGFSFLRHIERCRFLIYVVDMSQHEPWNQLDSLREELELYQEGLSTRPHAVVANKMDLSVSKRNLQAFRDKVEEIVFPLSAKHRQNIEPFVKHLRELYDKHQPVDEHG